MKCQGFHTHWITTLFTLFLVWHSDFLLFMQLMYSSSLLGFWSPLCSSLEFKHTALKWFIFLYALHVAMHYFWPYAVTQSLVVHLRLFILFFGLLLVTSLRSVATMYVRSLSCLFIPSNVFFCALCTSILCNHMETYSLSISLLFLGVVCFFIISCTISSSFIPFINCFQLPIMLFVIALSCFNEKSTHPLPHGFLLFSLQFIVL